MKLSHPIYKLKRRARLRARERGQPLHAALDQEARAEGFRSWSHLAAKLREASPAKSLLGQLRRGDLVLLGARPGHGKTLLGLELLAETARAGEPGMFFSLEYTNAEVAAHLKALGEETHAFANQIAIDTTDGICADYITDRLSQMAGPGLAVIDYLQLLDQRRSTPPLNDQLHTLRRAAERAGHVIVTISQIDRRFDPTAKSCPDLADVRLPNPVDLTQFTKSCFLHDGEMTLASVA